MAEVNALEQPFWRWARQQTGPWSEAMVDFRWQLEELRVALYRPEPTNACTGLCQAAAEDLADVAGQPSLDFRD